MARVSTQKGRVQYPTGTGQRLLSQRDISALTAERGAASRFIETIGIISAAEGRRIMQADEKAQTIEGIAGMKRQIFTLFDGYDTETDETKYRPNYNTVFEGFDTFINNFSNLNARTILELFRKENAPKWENSVNDAELNRKRTNSYIRRDLSMAGIKDLDLSDPLELDDAESRIEDGGTVMAELGHSPEDIELWKSIQYDIVKEQSIYQQAQNISAAQGYENAEKWIMKQDIDVNSKKKIISKINFEAAQQKLEYDKYVEKTEQEMFTEYINEQLSEDRINKTNIPVTRKLMWKRLVDAQVQERLKGEVPLNVDAYDKLEQMLEDYSNDKIGEDKVRKALSDAAGKDISTTIYRSLRTRLSNINKPDDPINKSSAKRALSILNELKGDDFFWPEGIEDDDPEGKRQNLLNYLDLTNEFEEYLTTNPDATDEQINDKVDTLTKPYIEEKTKGFLEWFGRLLRPKETTPFWRHLGTTEEEALARKKTKAGVIEENEPKTLSEFEETVGLLDEEEAKVYYEKWKNKW